MENLDNKEVEEDPKEDSKETFYETLRHLSIRFSIALILAVVVFVTGKFFWWLGFIFFIMLAIYFLSEILTVGSIFVLIVVANYGLLKWKTNIRTRWKSDTNEIFNKLNYVFYGGLLNGFYCLLLMILSLLLFLSFFTMLFNF